MGWIDGVSGLRNQHASQHQHRLSDNEAVRRLRFRWMRRELRSEVGSRPRGLRCVIQSSTSTGAKIVNFSFRCISFRPWPSFNQTHMADPSDAGTPVLHRAEVSKRTRGPHAVDGER
jgi:hypothetical protein